MDAMNRKNITLLALILCVGIFLGLLLGRWQAYQLASDATSNTSSDTTPSSNPLFDASNDKLVDTEETFKDTNEELNPSALQDELAQAMEERAQLRKQLTDVLNWILTNVRGKYPLPEKFMSKLRLQAVAADFTLDPEVAELLNITSEEEAVLNEAFSTTDMFLTEMNTALMRVSQPHEDKVIVHVPSFGDEGDIIREDLYLALEAVLGPNRFDRFMEVSEKELESRFDKFGMDSHTIVFEVVYGPNDEQPYLRIRDGRIAEDENGKRFVSATEETVAVLPDEYLEYLEWWLPDYNNETTP